MIGNKDLFPNLRTTPNPLRSAQRLSGSRRPLAEGHSLHASRRCCATGRIELSGRSAVVQPNMVETGDDRLRASCLLPALGRRQRAAGTSRPAGAPALARLRRAGSSLCPPPPACPAVGSGLFAAEPQPPYCQFSTLRPGTRANSLVLFVTSTAPRRSA